MFSQTKKLSSTECARIFDFLIFKIKHGGNIVGALKSYMEGNKSKSSQPVNIMLQKISEGENFTDVALEFGLIDRSGYLVLSSSVDAAKALPIVRNAILTKTNGVTSVIVADVLKKYAFSLLAGFLMLIDTTRMPMVSIFEKMNQSAKATGATVDPLPVYLADPWHVMTYVLAVGVVLSVVGGTFWWLNKYDTSKIYRIARFRFYEDWIGLLSLYLALKSSGQSDFKAAKSLASAWPEDSYIHNLFNEIAESMRSNGHSFYQVLAEQEGAIPSEVLCFFLDASKTGQFDVYIKQARDYCEHQLETLNQLAKTWMPALTGIVMLMTFGLMVADLFVELTTVSMKPMMG